VTIPKCLELVELCIQHNKLDEANRWLTHTNEIEASSSYQVYNIESTQIKLHQAEGNHPLALDMLWARFEEQEDAQTLMPTLAVAKEIQQQDIWFEKGISYIALKISVAQGTSPIFIYNKAMSSLPTKLVTVISFTSNTRLRSLMLLQTLRKKPIP